jgi:hypothetical protein
MLILLAMFLQVQSYEILIGRYQQYCLGEDLTSNTLVVGEIKLRDLRSHGSFSFFIKDKDGVQVYTKTSVREDKFSFVSTTDGQHLVCISSQSQGTMVLLFDLKVGVAAHDYSELPQAKDLKHSEFRVEVIVKLIQEIQKELSAIRERDAQMSHTNETISNRVVSYSVVTLVLLLVLAASQVIYLKGFLRSKKMI